MIIAKKCFFTKLALLLLVLFMNYSYTSDSQVLDRLNKWTNGSIVGAAAIIGLGALWYRWYSRPTVDPKAFITSDEQAMEHFESHPFDNQDLFWLMKQGYISTFSHLLSKIRQPDLIKIKDEIGRNLFIAAIAQEKYDFAKLIFNKLQELEIMAPIVFPGIELATLKENMQYNLTFLLFLIKEAAKSEFARNRLLFILEQYPIYLNELSIIDRSSLLTEVHEIEDLDLRKQIIKKVSDAPKLQYPA